MLTTKNTAIENRHTSTRHGEADPMRSAKTTAAVSAETALANIPIDVAALSERSVPISPSRRGRSVNVATTKVRIAGASRIVRSTNANFFLVQPAMRGDFADVFTKISSHAEL